MTRVQRPETAFAWNGDVALAYQVVGDGPIDLVYLQGFCSNIDLHWESPHLARFLDGLAALGRLIVTDRRGWGCSDRFSPTDVPPLESLTDDLQTVLDAVGSERAVVITSFETASLVLMFAAAHPERCAGLVLIDPWITWTATDETPWAPSVEEYERSLDTLRADYGTPRWGVRHMKPGSERDWWLRYLRASITPGSVVAEFRTYARTDVRSVLPLIHVPTLVLSSTKGESEDAPENGRFIERRVPSARNVELTPPDDEVNWLHWYGRAGDILRETGAFVATIRAEQATFDRVLATVLFSDIVDSTAVAARIGDAEWRTLVERHHATVRSLLARYRGKEADTAGDGFFATFDGPARAVTCAKAIVEAIRPLGIEVRVGVHTGEVETIDGKVGGLAVVIGSRLGALAGASEVLASQTVKDLTAGSGLAFVDAGEHELKGVPDRWRLYRVVG
jgi:class 3 adenylate cyclase/pimeloyl-ACP methyl ester carboxylesterase